mgnify:FL=1
MKRLLKAALSLALSLGLLGLSGCGTSPAPGSESSGSAAQEETHRVEPMAGSMDVSALAEGDNQFTAGFRGSDARLDDDGRLVIDLTVYTYDLYDAVEITTLTPGDTLVVKGTEIPVKTVEQGDGIAVNGGLVNGGIDLTSAGGGTFRVQLENDARDLYAVGTVTLPVGQDCVLTDDADPEDPGRTLYAGDLLGLGDEVFSPQATTVETVGGAVTAIHRDYTP